MSPGGAVLMAWLVPGGAHLAMGQTRRAAVLFAVLLVMFVTGLAFGGRLFPFQVSEPLVFLAAVAEWALAAPRLVAAVAGFGAGDVVAVTYEYGNTFLIAGGLLNMLVMLDAFDRATGRRR
jgi:nucleoside recognition membrane protein YjiH